MGGRTVQKSTERHLEEGDGIAEPRSGVVGKKGMYGVREEVLFSVVVAKKLGAKLDVISVLRAMNINLEVIIYRISNQYSSDFLRHSDQLVKPLGS